MSGRFMLWTSASVLTAGMSMAMLTGAGAALADQGPTANAGTDTAAQPSNSADKKPSSPRQASKPDSDSKDVAGADRSAGGAQSVDASEKNQQSNSENYSEGKVPPGEADSANTQFTGDAKPASSAVATVHQDRSKQQDTSTPSGQQTQREPRVDALQANDSMPGRVRALRQDTSNTAAAAASADLPAASAAGSVRDTGETSAGTGDLANSGRYGTAKDATDPARSDAATPSPVDETADTSRPSITRALASDVTPLVASKVPAAPAAPTGPTLINVIGTLLFGLFDDFTRAIQGAPAVPAGSTVLVGRSTLQIDCGTGYSAQADWYFPTGPEPPTRLIYFQHGILASDAFYNVTAAQLAQENDAIVVAPTITSNPFACDGCQLAGDQMHEAVAQLFLDPDRTALLASAQAAGFQGTQLPTDFVLSGHSEGGQLASGAAGYFEQLAPDDQTRHELVGVLLFDTADDNGVLPSADGPLTRALKQIPDDIPVLNIAATPNFLDAYGDANAALEAARPGQFNGVQLVGGEHSDAFQSTNPVIQFVVGLATGFSAPQNVDAVQVLAQGWINDMYARTVDDPLQRTGIYGDAGAVLTIPTDAGTAHAYVLPAPTTPRDALYPVYLILRNVLLAANFDFATCVAPAGDSARIDATHSAVTASGSCAATSRPSTPA